MVLSLHVYELHDVYIKALITRALFIVYLTFREKKKIFDAKYYARERSSIFVFQLILEVKRQ